MRVRLRIIALNHLDIWVTHGLPAPPGLPHILGGDGAGVVEAVGPGVEGLAEGDEVIINPSLSCGTCPVCASGETVYCRSFGVLGEHSQGTLAEKVVIPAANAVPKPPGLPWETAGSFSLATGTAYRMLRRARLQEGETLLVVGVGGGVSSAAALLECRWAPGCSSPPEARRRSPGLLTTGPRRVSTREDSSRKNSGRRPEGRPMW